MTKSKIRIVIADDHPIFRDGLSKLLALEQDFEVVAEVGMARQVLPVLKSINPDILLLDLKMPGRWPRHSAEAAGGAEQARRSSFLTASEDKNEFVQAMKLGTCGIVLKQSATELLFKSIRKVYAGEIWLDSHTTAAVMRQFVGERRSRLRRTAGRARETRALAAQPAGARDRGAGGSGIQEQGNGGEDVHQ